MASSSFWRESQAMAHILVVEDESNLVDLLRGYLEQEGYDVSQAGDGPEGVRQARETNPDLIILDVMLPGFDGVEVCRQIRRFSDAYVLMLTARAEELDKIVGLSVGADDYVAKPFSPREVVARVKALLRRPRGQLGTSHRADIGEPAVLRCGDLTIDEDQHTVRRAAEEIPLTAREFTLLLTLARHPGRVFTRAQLLEQVWGDEYYDDHVVDVHIGNLRKKLEDESADPRYVQTVRGVGYRLAAQATRIP
jgi:two-component system, OmpR family, alkaline phosphatase synthesis response regulator PhoP